MSLTCISVLMSLTCISAFLFNKFLLLNVCIQIDIISSFSMCSSLSFIECSNYTLISSCRSGSRVIPEQMDGTSVLNFPDNVVMCKMLDDSFSILIIGPIILSSRSFFFGRWKKLKTDVIIFVIIVRKKRCLLNANNKI